MGMHMAEMQQYGQLDPSERAKSGLPGSHPPVRGFYFVKPSAGTSSSMLTRTSKVLTRLRHPKGSSSAQTLSSLQETSSASDISASEVAALSLQVSHHLEAACKNVCDVNEWGTCHVLLHAM